MGVCVCVRVCARAQKAPLATSSHLLQADARSSIPPGNVSAPQPADGCIAQEGNTFSQAL